MPIKPGQIPGIEFIRTIKKKKEKEKKEEPAKNPLDEEVMLNAIVPPILYLANKAENGYEGDILSDFYRKFPQITTAVDPVSGEPYDPIFISAEHGDGLPDLF